MDSDKTPERNRDKKGKFITLKRKQREDKIVESVKRRKSAKNDEEPNVEEKENFEFHGRRIIEPDTLAKNLICIQCKSVLSLLDTIKELRRGVASDLEVKCRMCGIIQRVETCKSYETDNGLKRHYVNGKMVFGMNDIGIGPSNLNDFLSAINIPHVHAHITKEYQEIISMGVNEACQDNFRKAIRIEKEMTQLAEEQKRGLENEPLHTESNHPTIEVNESTNHVLMSALTIMLIVSIDAAWQKRGTGRTYNSKSGHSSIIGYYSGLILGVACKSSHCVLCNRGGSKDDHDCYKNWSGSSKAMEPAMAVELVVENPLLSEEGVRIGTVIADDDSSTINNLHQNASWPIEKWSDLNHATTNLSNCLWKLKLPSNIIEYFKISFGISIKKNKGDPKAVERDLLAVVPHAYGDHSKCGTWCGFHSEGSNYKHRRLPKGEDLKDEGKGVRQSLEEIFVRFSKKAKRLAPCGSTQRNESFNHSVTSRHPKDYCYAGTQTFPLRVQMTALHFNNGSQYISDVYNRMGYSPGIFTEKHRRAKDEIAKKRAIKCKQPEFKRKRKENKRKRLGKETRRENQEGTSYQSNFDFDNIADLVAECNKPGSPTDLSNTKIVVFDLETTSASRTSDICQIAAIHSDNSFNAYSIPSKRISPGASEVHKLTIEGGQLYWNNKRVQTIPIKASLEQFLSFLEEQSDGNGVLLLAHNGFNFDMPIIMRHMKAHGLFHRFGVVVRGFIDTLPIYRKKYPERKGNRNYSQKTLVEDFVGANATQDAHNALMDVRALSQVITATELTDNVLRSEAKSLSEYLSQRQAKQKLDVEKAQKKQAREILNKNKATLGVFENLTNPMRLKMAKAGLSLQLLQKMYTTGGADAVTHYLSESINQKPRVTKTKKILQYIISKLEHSCHNVSEENVDPNSKATEGDNHENKV